MKYKLLLMLLSIMLILTACNQRADANYLVGGNWIATAGFQDGEIKGEPTCNYFKVGLQFIDEETVYNADFDEKYYYSLSDRNKITEITIIPEGPGIFVYNIHVIGENEMALVWPDDDVDNSCYLERQ